MLVQNAGNDSGLPTCSAARGTCVARRRRAAPTKSFPNQRLNGGCSAVSTGWPRQPSCNMENLMLQPSVTPSRHLSRGSGGCSQPLPNSTESSRAFGLVSVQDGLCGWNLELPTGGRNSIPVQVRTMRGRRQDRNRFRRGRSRRQSSSPARRRADCRRIGAGLCVRRGARRRAVLSA